LTLDEGGEDMGWDCCVGGPGEGGWRVMSGETWWPEFLRIDFGLIEGSYGCRWVARSSYGLGGEVDGSDMTGTQSRRAVGTARERLGQKRRTLLTVLDVAGQEWQGCRGGLSDHSLGDDVSPAVTEASNYNHF
jgi:hypothetical protein